MIPPELLERQHWCSWRYEQRQGSKPTKVPYNPITNKRVSCNEPDTWLPFHEVKLSTIVYDGIGFFLSPDDPYCFIDLDATDSAEDIDFQQRIVGAFDSYTEHSPSGKGLHIICKGKVPCGHRSRSCEIYSSQRYMTMTGDVYKNAPINSHKILCEKLWQTLGQNKMSMEVPTVTDGKQTVEDEEVLKIARGAVNAPKFNDLWNGDFAKYYPKGNGEGDHSAADFALVDMLSFYTPNREQIKRLFFMSKLGFRKKARRAGYLDNMIDKSFDKNGICNTSEQFNGLIADMKQMLADSQDKKPALVAPSLNQILDSNITVKNLELSPDSKSQLGLPPGLTGQIASFILNQSYKPVPDISIFGALGMMAGLCGKAYNVSATGLNLYMVLLGETGRGKEEMIKGISKIIDQARTKLPTIADVQGPADLASGQGLLRFIGDHNTGSMLSIFGEFSHKLKSISDPKSNSAERMLCRVMLDLYNKSGHGSTVQTTAYSDADKNTKILHSPAFSFIGETQPESFYDILSYEMIKSGFLPRICVYEYKGDRPASNYDAHKVVPDLKLLTDVTSLATQCQQNIAGNTVINVGITEEAALLDKAMDKEYDAKLNDKTSPKESRELWNRVHMNTKKVAAILAVGVNYIKPEIDKECWLWARKFTELCCDNMTSRFDNNLIGEDAHEQKRENDLDKVIKQYISKGFQQANMYLASLTEEMHTDCVIPWAYFQRRTGSMSSFRKHRNGKKAGLKEAVQNLLDCGDLIEVEAWRAKERYLTGQKCYLVTKDMVWRLTRPEITDNVM